MFNLHQQMALNHRFSLEAEGCECWASHRHWQSLHLQEVCLVPHRSSLPIEYASEQS